MLEPDVSRLRTDGLIKNSTILEAQWTFRLPLTIAHPLIPNSSNRLSKALIYVCHTTKSQVNELSCSNINFEKFVFLVSVDLSAEIEF